MDFGNILDQWENEQGKKQPKKNKNPQDAGPGPSPKPHPLAAWLGENEVFDKDAEDPNIASQRVSAGERRRRLLSKRPDASIDLHGLTRDQAWAALEQFFDSGRRQDFQKLEIIHGKGNHSQGDAVLKHTVQEFIERCSFAGESGHGSAAEGGTGATWVLLK